MELLSPVGNMECLKAAVQNGCDSVYLGADIFSARANATNFNLEALSRAIHYAKLRNVKTYLTLNTLIKDSEWDQAICLATKAYEYGIDAIIVQDLGLALALISSFPDLPIHGSTQMTIHNLEGAIALRKLGFKRAVLARELPLNEIEYISKNSGIEIETFIHGALCLSYSGQCLFSSMVGARSGNRGQCAQPCRLPYSLIQKTKEGTHCLDKGYLLSTKDLCGLSFLPDLLAAGVSCLKIEGRMKNPEYVAIVTKIYRQYLDMALSGKSYCIKEEDKKALLQAFNRGGFSSGHLSSKANRDLVFPEKPHNMGLYLGSLSNIQPKKGHISLSLSESISIGDTISIHNHKYTVSELMQKGKNQKQVHQGIHVTLGRMKGDFHIGDPVYKLAEKALLLEAKKTYQEGVEIKTTSFQCRIVIKKDKPISLEVTSLPDVSSIFKGIHVSIDSDVVPIAAKNKPITVDKIISQLSKTGNTPYRFDSIEVVLEDNLFIPSIKILNQLRRKALEEVEKIAIGNIQRIHSFSSKHDIKKQIAPRQKNTPTATISLLLNQLDLSYDYSRLSPVDRIYIPLKYFIDKKVEAVIQQLARISRIYIYMPTIVTSNYHNLLVNNIEMAIHKFPISGFVVSNIAGMILIDNFEKTSSYQGQFDYIANYTLNVWNHHTAEALANHLGVSTITLSPELDKETLCHLLTHNSHRSEVMIYGNIPVMTSQYCFLGRTNKCYPTCGAKCQNKEAMYYLKDRLGYTFRIIPDNIQTVTTLYNSKTTFLPSHEIPSDSYRIDLLDETIEQINHIIKLVLQGKRFEGNDYTNSNFHRNV